MGTVRLRLADPDRDRLGCPEWLDLDPQSVTNREAVEIRDVLGFATPGLMRDALLARPVLDSAGEKVLYSNGRPAETTSESAWTGLVWVALRRAGVHTDLATLEFSFEMLQFEVRQPADPVETPVGKAPARRRSTRSTRQS